MPAATAQRHQPLIELENGLKALKGSKLRSHQEFETMYNTIEEHHRNLKLGYLTGMASDRRKQAEKDTKFYYILAKMMAEVDCGGEPEKQSGLAQVYNWFEQHKESLYTGPRFGRSKRKSSGGSARPSTAGGSSTTSSRVHSNTRLRPGSSISQISSAKSRRTNTPVQQQSPDQSTVTLNRETFDNHQREVHIQNPPGSPQASETSAAAEYYFRQYGEGHIEDVGLQHESQGQPPVSDKNFQGLSESSQTVITRPHSAPIQHEQRPQAPTPDAAMRGRRPNTAASESVLLPRRKPLPLPHVFNPLSKAFDTTVEQLPGSGPPTDRSTSGNGPARFQLSSRGGSVYQDPSGGVISLRMTHLQKWGSFQHNQSQGQDMLAKLQHVGRGGVPGSTRYAAHELGLTTEDMTQDVIANYAFVDEYKKMQNGTTPRSDSRALVERPLEEFYESTEPYYPVKRNKYPSFRGKSAPPGGKAARAGGNKENLVSNSGPLSKDEEGSLTGSTIRLDSLVNMIDTVTDEMTTHKEKVAPDPLPGFRQPTVVVDPQSRPATAPIGMRTRTVSPPDDRDARSESHMYVQVTPGREQLLLRPASEGAANRAAIESSMNQTFELLDWRGKVTPDTTRSKWSQGFGSHSFVQKMSRPKSSLRSNSHGGSMSTLRPKTPTPSMAPTVEERWQSPPAPEPYTVDHKRPPVAASHTTTEVDDKVVSSLLTTTKFQSNTMRTRPQIEEDDDDSFMFDLRDFSPSRVRFASEQPQQDNQSPSMEYMTFCTSMQSQIAPRTSAKEGSLSSNSGLVNDSVQSQSPEAAQRVRMPMMLNTSNFLEEVQRLVAAGALEEQETEEGRQNTARSISMDPVTTGTDNRPEDAPGAFPGEEGAGEGKSSAEEPSKKRLTFCLEEGKPPVAPGEGDDSGKEKEFGLDEEESAIMNVDIDHYVRTFTPTVRGASSASSRLSQGYKHRVFQHAFPTTPRGTTDASGEASTTDASNSRGSTTTEEGLSIEGCGARTADKRKSRPGSSTSTNAAQSTASESKKKASGASKTRRTVGTVPPRAKSANPMRVLQKQSEMLKNSPVEPYRTPPSIPTPWGQFGTRNQKKPPPPHVPPPQHEHQQQPYSVEHEAHSRKMSSPRHYIERVTEMRRPPTERDDPVPRLPPPEEMSSQERQLVEPLKVFRMRHEDGTIITISSEPRAPRSYTRHSNAGDESVVPCAACEQEESGQQGEFMGQRLLDMGRPIPHYLPAADPLEVAAAAQRLKEAQAAVDIQRIFRGYVARNQYKYLMTEERQKREDQQKAAIEIQRRMRGHLSRKRAIYNRKPDVETLAWAKEYRIHQKDRERVRKVKALEDQERLGRKNAEKAAKLAIIGPHVDVYEPFHPKKTGPDKALLNKAATVIQKTARGFLVKKRMERLRRKSKYHASSWSKFMSHYRELLRRIQLRAGIDKPRTPFDFRDISEYMDLKKRYESVFDKRAFGGEMEHEELPAFFTECDLYPARSEVEDACASIFRGQILKKPRGLYKQEVLEVTFQIYPPKGTGLQCTRKSTWLNPIVDGEEAIKLSGTDNVELTDFKTCWKLVSGVAKERREMEAEVQRLAEEEQERLEDELRRKRREEQAAAAKKKPAGDAAGTAGKQGDGQVASTSSAVQPETPSAPEVEAGKKSASTADLVAVLSSRGGAGLTGDAGADAHASGNASDAVPTGEKKSFIEQKLERIENEAPAWVPDSDGETVVEQPALQPHLVLEAATASLKPPSQTSSSAAHSHDSSTNNILAPIAESSAETETKSK